MLACADPVIVEHALLPVAVFDRTAFEAAMQAAIPLIAASPGFAGIEVRRPVGDGSHYLLLVHWMRLEDHREGFRQSDRYQHWRALLHPYYDVLPAVTYFEDVPVCHA
jgi:heme-degrading monooxygenase HmoA